MPTGSIDHTTRDHDEIRSWVEKHDGEPAMVTDTQEDGGGVLRIDFPDGSDAGLSTVSWDEWFDTFDSRELAFVYQERKADGEDSTFCKVIDAADA